MKIVEGTNVAEKNEITGNKKREIFFRKLREIELGAEKNFIKLKKSEHSTDYNKRNFVYTFIRAHF